MGGAILAGLTAPGVTVDGVIRVTNRTAAKAEPLTSDAVESLAIETTPDANAQAVRDARVVLLGVKPAMIPDTLRDLAPHLRADAIVISVAAGVTIATMEAIVPNVVLRAMPNTPSLVGKGVTGLAGGSRSTADDLAVGTAVFATVGAVLEVPESKIDALSTISGSGPAYVFFLIEQLERTAVDLGFTPEEAATMVQGTFLGASLLLEASDADPAELRRRVTSPKGTTERAIGVLAEADLKHTFDEATAAALARAQELAAG